MDLWIKEFSELIHMMLGSPKGSIGYLVILAVVILVLLVAMGLVGSAMRIPNLGIIRRVLALVIGIGFLMCVWICVHKYLLPFTEIAWLRQAITYGVPLIACLAVVIPVQQFIFKSSYTATVITFAVSLVVAALFVVLANAVLVAVADGKKESISIKEHENTVNKIIED
jgi:hypothetical protein